MSWWRIGRVVSVFPIYEAKCRDIVRFKSERLEVRENRSTSVLPAFTPESFSMSMII
jgi:hypothetical protein